ncbi:hypothetical protein AMTRI_Chr03g55930 [Amborella trichopoda]|uniref:Protein kinase domain-containing protein n=1 Tax=Amborella trichopoda TaxID=13333 RepID=W1NDY6_AMBTC|nr:probable inactive leucine-rich repeat receptor-like protein kinase At3g03770 [Amborella trichopoda]XP_020517433.1 probable inactive leucine-rich repeat receptor-like protein kinase At3g03770 [Amborella trichopoda]ERM93573.1 hypothetical protein AMTR_s00004p00110090 [Amborella trichopoda]|eukprot:XP_006826336.1 probable inactive leucine-rich repeat receptor-like protein kinase At3g03770 [Amborella trichopoda]
MVKGENLPFLLLWVALIPVIILIFLPCTLQLQSSQAQALLRVQRLLGFPAVLSSWNNWTDFCNTPPASSLSVVCYEESITQLHIVGSKGSPPVKLKRTQNFTASDYELLPTFSIDSFLTTLTGLPNLKVLSLVSLGLWGQLPPKIARLYSLEILNVSSNFFYGRIPQEISLLRNLQTLILDDNLFTGSVPDWFSALPVLTVLSLRNNSFSGSLPSSLKTMESLRVLVLSTNQLYGEVPDISSLTNLQILDLENNNLGPQFPILGNKIVKLVLRKNRFSSNIPSEIASCFQLKKLDLSFNRFLGPLSLSLFSLPAIEYLDLGGNKLTGMLSENISCNNGLQFVDISSNLLTGTLPHCLEPNSRGKVVRYAGNCLVNDTQYQHPYLFCKNEALAVGVLPRNGKKKESEKVIFLIGILGVTGGMVVLGLFIWVFIRRSRSRKPIKRSSRRLVIGNALARLPSKVLADARYISQTMSLSALGLPPYRNFSLEELEEATDNFHTSTFMGEGSHDQMYKGILSDGSVVAIRCLKLKQKYSPQTFLPHIELISKIRHRHLVSVLGHCIECYLDDSTVSRLLLIFEYVPYGTLRANVCERMGGEPLSWTQRLAAAIGVARGIEFLHTGVVPGLFDNDLKITNILLDQNHVAKISSYNLPVLANNMKSELGAQGPGSGRKEFDISKREKRRDAADVYNFGIILLEVIMGRAIEAQSEVDTLRDQLQQCVIENQECRRSVADPWITDECVDESLRTAMAIAVRCLCKEHEDRPSIEDVLWNLQFAAQVQDASSQGSDGSPNNTSD